MIDKSVWDMIRERREALPENATVTVTYEGRSVTFNLDGVELTTTAQANGTMHNYLTTASRDFVAAEVEKALLTLTNRES